MLVWAIFILIFTSTTGELVDLETTQNWMDRLFVVRQSKGMKTIERTAVPGEMLMHFHFNEKSNVFHRFLINHCGAVSALYVFVSITNHWFISLSFANIYKQMTWVSIKCCCIEQLFTTQRNNNKKKSSNKKKRWFENMSEGKKIQLSGKYNPKLNKYCRICWCVLFHFFFFFDGEWRVLWFSVSIPNCQTNFWLNSM